MLAEYGITALPWLADVLPILIQDEHIDVKGAARVLDGVRELDAGTEAAEPVFGT